MKKRILWVDLVRISAIYLVLVDHSTKLPPLLPPNMFNTALLTFPFVATCVPLFVMISGALLLGKTESYPVFFKKRLGRLVSPWLIWAAVATFVFTGISTIPHLLRAYVTQIEGFWFLPMIAGLYLLTPAARIFVKSAKNRDMWFIVLIWFSFVSLFPYNRNSLMFPLHTDDGLLRQIVNYSGYFLLGYLLVQTRFAKSWIAAITSSLFGFFLTLSAVVFIILSHSGGLTSDQYSYIAPGIIILSVGVFLFGKLIGERLETKVSSGTRNMITLLSTYALSIYLTHRLLQAFFLWLFHKSSLVQHVPLANFINGAILYLASFVFLFILSRVPYLKMFIL